MESAETATGEMRAAAGGLAALGSRKRGFNSKGAFERKIKGKRARLQLPSRVDLGEIDHSLGSSGGLA